MITVIFHRHAAVNSECWCKGSTCRFDILHQENSEIYLKEIQVRTARKHWDTQADKYRMEDIDCYIGSIDTSII